MVAIRARAAAALAGGQRVEPVERAAQRLEVFGGRAVEPPVARHDPGNIIRVDRLTGPGVVFGEEDRQV